MPRLPPVTSATRPVSSRGRWLCSIGPVLVCIAFMALSCSTCRTLCEPLDDVWPDAVAGVRADHQPDVPARAIEMGDVRAADQVEDHDGALAWRDAVGRGRDDQQVRSEEGRVGKE